MPFDVLQELEILLGQCRDQGGTVTGTHQEFALRQLERRIRNDECEQIMSGYRNTGGQTMHDYLEKRIAKRK